MRERIPVVFDRRRHRMRRDRSAADFSSYAFLKERAALDLTQRLVMVKRRFARVLDLGAHSGQILRAVDAHLAPDAVRVHMDFSPAFAALGPDGAAAIAADEENPPFADATFDLILSGLSLHWVNDLPGALSRIRQMLKPDGLFIGSLLGGRTLYQLRECLLEAELAIRDGASQRVSPFVRAVDLAYLLQNCGFAMPVADVDACDVRYPGLHDLFRDLRGMGERAIPAKPVAPLDRRVIAATEQLYRKRFAAADNKIPARFDIITASGWSPGPGQPQVGPPGFARSGFPVKSGAGSAKP